MAQTKEQIAATLKSNTQKEEARIAKEEKDKAAAAKKKADEFDKNMKKVLLTDATGGATGLVGSKITQQTNKRFTKEERPDETEEMNALDKAIAESKERVEMFWDEARSKYANDPEAGVAFVQGAVQTIGRNGTTLHLDETNKALKAHKDFIQNVTDIVYADYWNGKGRPDLAAMSARASGMVGNKQNPNRSGMDKLIEGGAPEVEMPEIPDDENAYLAEVITGMVGDVIANSMAWASGGTTAVAAASVPSAGQQVAANVSTMMTTDVAQHREKIEKIRLLNEELRIKHESDVIAAMVDFDNRVDASERAYNQMKFQAMGMEMARAFEVLGMKQEAIKTQADIGRIIDAATNAWERYEDAQDTAVKQFNANAKNHAALQKARYINDANSVNDKIEMYRQKNRYVPYANIQKAMPVMFAKGVNAAPRALETIVSQINVEGSQRNMINYNNGFNHSASGYSAINRLPLNAEQKGILLNNILVMGINNFTLNDLSENTLTQLSKEPIIVSPAGKVFQSGASATQYFRQRDPKERNFVLGSMHGYLEGMSSTFVTELINAKNKMGDKQKPADFSIVNTSEE